MLHAAGYVNPDIAFKTGHIQHFFLCQVNSVHTQCASEELHNPTDVRVTVSI